VAAGLRRRPDADIISAFRKVGIAGNVLAPELIDRSEFIDQPAQMAAAAAAPPSPAPARAAEYASDVAKTPPGVRSGTVAAERAKVAALLAYAQGLELKLAAPFDPTALLVPDASSRARRRGRGRRAASRIFTAR